MDDQLPVLTTLEDLVPYAEQGAFVRFSKGPSADRGRCSHDYESGLDLPGISVNPLAPEPWWTRPTEDWLARQLCNYVHLLDNAHDERRAWILQGNPVARGPDNEPVVTDFRPLALLDRGLIEQAKRRYQERFDVAEDST